MAVVFGGGLFVWILGQVRNLAFSATACAAGGAVFGVTFTMFLWRSQRARGGRVAALERTRAVRLGRLPASADRSWVPGLQVRRQNARQQRWVPALVALVPIGLGLGHVRDLNPLPSIYWFGLAAFLLIVAIRAVVRAPQRLAVLDRLIRQLEQLQQ